MKYITTTFFLLVFTMAAITASAQLGIGTETPDSSAALDVESTERGVLIPRMTVIQRDAINNPASGLMVYVTDFQCMQVNDGTPAEPLWRCVSGIGGSSGYVMALSNCASPTVNIPFRPLIENELANGISVDIDYVGGNGGTYKAQVVRSTGVMGLTAMLPAGRFAAGDSIVRFTITGTPLGFGTANFAISVGGKRCTIGLRVIRLYTYGFATPNGTGFGNQHNRPGLVRPQYGCFSGSYQPYRYGRFWRFVSVGTSYRWSSNTKLIGYNQHIGYHSCAAYRQ
jgi:hypothetical protein